MKSLLLAPGDLYDRGMARPTPAEGLKEFRPGAHYRNMGDRHGGPFVKVKKSAAMQALVGLSLLAGCTATVGDGPARPGGGGTGNVAGAAGPATGGNTGGNIAGTGSSPGSGGTPGGTGATGGSGTLPGGSGGSTPVANCTSISPGRAPLRRLTTFEYNNTVRDLLFDTTSPGTAFPPQVTSKENDFGNDADEQSISDLLIEQYARVAEGIAARATANAMALGRLHTCATTVTPATEETCARNIVNAIAPGAYRRAITTADADELVTLYRTVRGLSPTITFASGVAAILEHLLQSPEFIYRVEFGTPMAGDATLRKLTGRELATRLSYLFWQTMPDVALFQAADSGALATKDGVLTQARRLLGDGKARPTVAFFFDNLLPIADLSGLQRAPAEFPTFSGAIGANMRQETQRLLEHEIFENTAAVPGSPYVPGSWPAALTAPYTFVNQALFNFYGASAFAAGTTVTGTALTKVNFNTSQRLGLLTLAGVMAGTATTNLTNPVLRGGFVVKKLMCRDIPLPMGIAVSPPEPYTGKTARERYTQHSAAAACRGCHQFMDPVGLALENYDAVGLYRTTERATIAGVTYDTPIDATGSVPGVPGMATTPVELVKLIASSEEIENCFAARWMQYGYGRTLDAADSCNQQSVQTAFKSAGYNVKQLLLALTQADAFQYLRASQ